MHPEFNLTPSFANYGRSVAGLQGLDASEPLTELSLVDHLATYLLASGEWTNDPTGALPILARPHHPVVGDHISAQLQGVNIR